MIIELHALQTFAPSNLNRDDTGNPKDALFGGVRRARISSQSAKRAMRVSDVFKQGLAPMDIGLRTRYVATEITKRLKDLGYDQAIAQEQTNLLIAKLFAKADGKNADRASVLIYLSSSEFDWLTQKVIDLISAGHSLKDSGKEEDKKWATIKKEFVKTIKERSSAPDIALFGRMLAESPELNIDAACQVEHALSTHEVATAEFDYFTTVDDLSSDEQSGAGMLGLVAYNSATYYRCVRIHWDQLVKNLNGDVATATLTVDSFMKAFALVVPTGMQNRFLNQHMPDFLLAVARPYNDGQSLMNAFEKPINAPRQGGYAQPSINALVKYWDETERAFRLYAPQAISVLDPHGYLNTSEELQQATVNNLMDWVYTITSVLPTE